MFFPKLKPSMSPRISACVARPARPGNMYLPSCHLPAGPIKGDEESKLENKGNFNGNIIVLVAELIMYSNQKSRT